MNWGNRTFWFKGRKIHYEVIGNLIKVPQSSWMLLSVVRDTA